MGAPLVHSSNKQEYHIYLSVCVHMIFNIIFSLIGYLEIIECILKCMHANLRLEVKPELFKCQRGCRPGVDLKKKGEKGGEWRVNKKG